MDGQEIFWKATQSKLCTAYKHFTTITRFVSKTNVLPPRQSIRQFLLLLHVFFFPLLFGCLQLCFNYLFIGTVHLYLSASKSPALPWPQTSGHLKTVIWQTFWREQAKCANHRSLPCSCWSCAMPTSMTLLLSHTVHWIILMHAPADNKGIDDILSARGNLAEQQFKRRVEPQTAWFCLLGHIQAVCEKICFAITARKKLNFILMGLTWRNTPPRAMPAKQ